MVPQSTPLDAKVMADASSAKPSAEPAPNTQPRAARSLVDAELAIAKLADQEGNVAAFLGVLDDTGVLFRPGPVNGKAWLRRQHPDTSKLTWFPSLLKSAKPGISAIPRAPPVAGSSGIKEGIPRAFCFRF